MLPYQEKYIQNTRAIYELHDFFRCIDAPFDTWYQSRKQSESDILSLYQENNALLREYLFPVLDTLHSADADTIRQLSDFSDVLMDWSTNLDAGVYVLIHEAMLRLARMQKDTRRILQELYKLGMGMYYQNRHVLGLRNERTRSLHFQNEMVFTEAASYLQHFSRMPDDETRGYIVRSLANIAICSQDSHRKIAASGTVLQLAQDPDYRALAPTLPWDTFLRKTHQQMSANRKALSSGDLTRAELATVLESCHVVFQPEEKAEHPSVRWLWPYYEMEYSCGLANISTTMARMRHLIDRTEENDYSIDGLYANVQLTIYYGSLMKEHPLLQRDLDHMNYLAEAYQKMMRVLLSYPADQLNDFFLYVINLALTEYYETDGTLTYREVSGALMQRFAGALYLRSVKVGKLARMICQDLFTFDPAFFDDIPLIQSLPHEEKLSTILSFAEGCGLYHDFGYMKMNLERLRHTRSLFDREYQIDQLHTYAGYDDLIKHPSTRMFADIALGHHRWYDGTQGFPESYLRNQSAYRQMTDVIAVAVCIAESVPEEFPSVIRNIIEQSGRQFSPLIVSCLTDHDLLSRLQAILREDEEPSYREIYNHLHPVSHGG